MEQGLAELDLKSLCENQPEILAPAQHGEAAGERAAQQPAEGREPISFSDIVYSFHGA